MSLKHIGFLNAGQWISVLNWTGPPLITVYFVSIFVLPFTEGDWDYVQRVWNTWQALNVGILAFVSSLIAFNISRFNAEQQRKREFTAARAFLPEAFSELTSYFESCSLMLNEAFSRAKDKSDNCKTPLVSVLPELPLNYKEVFSKGISFAEPDVAERLAHILMRLQIHHSRLESLNDDFSEDSRMVLTSYNIISKMYSLGELQALVNKTFKFARGQEAFDSSPLKLSDFTTAYLGLNIEFEFIEGLYEFTERACEANT